MAKSRPRKNQSERSDLPCHIIIVGICYSAEQIVKPGTSLEPTRAWAEHNGREQNSRLPGGFPIFHILSNDI